MRREIEDEAFSAFGLFPRATDPISFDKAVHSSMMFLNRHPLSSPEWISINARCVYTRYVCVYVHRQQPCSVYHVRWMQRQDGGGYTFLAYTHVSRAYVGAGSCARASFHCPTGLPSRQCEKYVQTDRSYCTSAAALSSGTGPPQRCTREACRRNPARADQTELSSFEGRRTGAERTSRPDDPRKGARNSHSRE